MDNSFNTTSHPLTGADAQRLQCEYGNYVIIHMSNTPASRNIAEARDDALA
jgi:hypothetical protein